MSGEGLGVGGPQLINPVPVARNDDLILGYSEISGG